MDVMQAIMNRRSCKQFLDAPVSLAQVLPWLEAAIMAPNHHLTQPWQFVWVGAETKARLAERYAHARALKKGSEQDLEFAQRKQKAIQRFMSMPAIVMVLCRRHDDPVTQAEDLAATHCAIQNMLLAATDAGFGTQWSSPPLIREAATLEILGVDAQQYQIAAMVYVGMPASVTPPPPRKALDRCLTVLP
jgi:nitroreductase